MAKKSKPDLAAYPLGITNFAQLNGICETTARKWARLRKVPTIRDDKNRIKYPNRKFSFSGARS